MNKMRYLSKRNHNSQTESLELKNSVSEMEKKKAVESICKSEWKAE